MNSTTSHIISYLRFPLCVAIIMIHSDIAVYNTTAEDSPIYLFFSNVFVGSICSSAVALFFFISGYLFFHEGTFSFNIYRKKITHRIHSILIPYILWNAICFVFLFVMQHLFNNFNLLLHKQIVDFKLQDFLYIFWNIQKVTGLSSDQAGPLVGQFWFLQCLLVFSLLSPIIYIGIKKTKLFFLIVIVGLNFADVIPNIPGFDTMSLFYYTLGAYFSINKTIWYSDKSYIGILLIIGYSVVYTCRTYFQLNNYKIIDETLLIFGILTITHILTKNKKPSKQTLFLCNCSFFTFAIHRYFTSIGLNITKDWHFHNGGTAIICFALITTISTLCCILSYKLMNKYLPKTTRILNGNRIK